MFYLKLDLKHVFVYEASEFLTRFKFVCRTGTRDTKSVNFVESKLLCVVAVRIENN